MATLHEQTDYKYVWKDYEEAWLSLIDKSTVDEMNSYAEETKDWSFFFNFSPLRHSAWCWYPFNPCSSILEIGAGYGALTGLLCERCNHVVAFERYPEKAKVLYERYKDRNNLDIYTETLEHLNMDEKFDYIIFHGSFGYQCNGSKEEKDYVLFLSGLKKHLKKDARVLIATDNRLGVEYLCGKPAMSTNIPFDTLMNYASGSKYHNFTKIELENIVKQAGFKHYKFYYPLPDWKYAQEIYTDQHKPNKKSMERVVNYYTYENHAIADEKYLLQEFIQNDSFSCVANSFLLEVSVDEVLSDVLYATCTAEREQKNSFMTILYESNRVEKKPIYRQGEETLKRIYENHEILRRKGIPVIQQELKGNVLHMPFIQYPTLSEYLMTNTFEHKQELYDIFDQLYSYIQNASLDGRTYIDMVPFNCFVTEEKEFLFFDQEFVKETCCVDYVMYRALMYTYLFSPELSKLVTLEEMKHRYQLKDTWGDFEEEEKRFVSSNRQYNKNRMFWKHTYLNPDTIRQNKNRFKRNSDSVIIPNISNDGKKEYNIGYIAGVFDLFHVGHLNLVRNAKEKCNKLMVGILTDDLVEHFKGKKPYIPLNERMEIVASTKYVDEVVSVDFDNIDKIDAWNLYHFDCLFSGDDWKDSLQWKMDQEKLRELGSDIYFFEYTKSTSSTQIKELMKERKL